jgi:hypothetical protein
VVVGKKVARSPSIYPDDPESAHYDPNCYAQEAHGGHEADHEAKPHALPEENGFGPDGGPASGPAPDSPPLHGGA